MVVATRDVASATDQLQLYLEAEKEAVAAAQKVREYSYIHARKHLESSGELPPPVHRSHSRGRCALDG